MSQQSELYQLQQLAESYGVLTHYYDMTGRRQEASGETLLAVLRSLGAPVDGMADVPGALREHRQNTWRKVLGPVAVFWEGAPAAVEFRLPASLAEASLHCCLRREGGPEQDWTISAAALPVIEVAEIEGEPYHRKKLGLPGLPPGYHRISVDLPGHHAESFLISAPQKAFSPAAEREWGVFIPLYALRRRQDWGSGSYTDLATLTDYVAGMGGNIVGTLPLLPAFLDDVIFEPSPYRPASRLFWNEFYIDINAVPELAGCPAAQALLASASFQAEIEAQRRLPLVDYRRQMASKRQVLTELCRCCFDDAERRKALLRFSGTHPRVADYARFRAVGERQRTPWPSWPQSLREGNIQEGDYDEEARRYHLYVQWLAHQQMEAVSTRARGKGVKLYLDLPVGVHPDGYDTWSEREVFVNDVSAGAPPDIVFTSGQDWSFPPLHPEKQRERGYGYFIAYLRHHLRQTGLLRIDHVMGLHRLFWIPRGVEIRQGTYVRYPAEELYAILALESQRQHTIIVGEDLGLVPPEVRPALEQHGLQRMYIMHFELTGNPQAPLNPPPLDCVASLNTHDMPPFAAFWEGLDITQRLELSLIDADAANKERQDRQATRESLVKFLREKHWLKEDDATPSAVLKACLAFLSAGPARFVLLNLEDLWLEQHPQNVPGTDSAYPNWRRKAHYDTEAFPQLPGLYDTLKMVDQFRKRGA